MRVFASLFHSLLIVVLACALVACGQVASVQPTSLARATAQGALATNAPKRATATPRPKVRATAIPATESGLEHVALGDLPPEAKHTFDLIKQGGPFPYDRDGVTFQNREQILPKKATGYYHEYTVPTPGEDDRGARRLITGKQGEIYYTADHYASFVEVVP